MSARCLARRAAGSVAFLAAAGVLASCSGGDTVTVTADFTDVGDLVTGHAVQMADVRIGRVTGIELTDEMTALVTMEVEESAQVPADSTALLRTTSLLGEKFIELRPNGDPAQGAFLADGAVIEKTDEAPELENVTEQAVRVLGGVVSTDLATLVETGAVGFGERGPELEALIDDLSVISATLAERTGTINEIIDNLGSASATLARGQDEIDGLLVNLADTTEVLVENRDRAVVALRELTRLARIQDEEIFRPHLADVDRQLKQLDAVLVEVASSSAEVTALLSWLDRFASALPVAIPGDFAQIYLWYSEDE